MAENRFPIYRASLRTALRRSSQEPPL